MLYSMGESHVGLISIIGSCLRIIVLELITSFFVKAWAYTLALFEGFLVKYYLI